MDEKNFGNILTIILIILIVAILGILVYFGYSTFKESKIQANADTALKDFNESNKNKKPVNKVEDTVSDTTDRPQINLDGMGEDLDNTTVENPQEKPVTEKEKVYMENYEVIGSIKIPKTGIEYPILERQTTRALELAITKLHGVGLNEVGNVTLTGHNYRNGLFFSNNKKLTNGDKVYITDSNGTTITYIIYNMYYTTPDDASYMTRDTNGKREISLSTCSDDSATRLIILAAEQ